MITFYLKTRSRMKDLMTLNLWISYLLLTLLATIIATRLIEKSLHKLIARAKKTTIVYDEAFLIALQTPLKVLTWLIGVCFCASIISYHQPSYSVPHFVAVKKTGVILILYWIMIRLIKETQSLYLHDCSKRKKEVDKTFVHALSQLLTITATIVATLLMMQVLEIPIAGLLAFGGIGGAGVAFAAKDLLANFFGGLVIYLDRPFKVGEWIRSPDKNIEGFVEYIGWRVTKIRTLERRPLYVPNGLFLTICVENPSRMENRRIKTSIPLRYEDADKVASITQTITHMLATHPEIDTNQTFAASLSECTASSLNLIIYAFTKTTLWMQFQAAQQDILLKSLEIIKNHGAQCASPAVNSSFNTP